jgi:hypothetical protein
VAVAESNSAITVDTRVESDGSVGIGGEFEIVPDVLDQNKQQVHSARLGVSLEVFSGRDLPVAEIAGPCQIPDHDLLDVLLAKGNPGLYVTSNMPYRRALIFPVTTKPDQ